MDKKLTFTVPERLNGITVLTFLKRECGLSSRMIARLKREKDGILRNGRLLKTIDTLRSGDTVVISVPEDDNKILPVKGALDILFEDENLLVLNKPAGLTVHPTKVYQTDTLANFTAYYAQSKGESYAFRAVNRLDRDTSGIVIAAKNAYSAYRLSNNVQKTYYAVCEGIISAPLTVSSPIKIKEGHTVQRCVSPDGKSSVTHITPLARGNNHTLLEITLETGRTHQIRCHLSSIFHPLAGDDMYGGSLEFISRQALHCGKAELVHPISGETLNIATPVPSEFYKIFQQGDI